MLEYTCTDGPLAGAVIYTRQCHTVGEVLGIEVVDIGQAPDVAEVHSYSVTVPADGRPGRLAFVRGPATA